MISDIAKTLRYSKAETITVPSGQVWRVKLITINSDTPSSGVGGVISATISGNTFYLTNQTVSASNPPVAYYGGVATQLILKAGDSIFTNSGYDVVIYYYQIELDIEVSLLNALPDMRYLAITSTTTVPVGQTWIIQLMTYVRAGSGSFSYQSTLTLGGNTSITIFSISGTVANYAITLGSRNLVLNAGDSINVPVITGTGTNEIQIGYYIKEQDPLFASMV